jgi:hypothetical protein
MALTHPLGSMLVVSRLFVRPLPYRTATLISWPKIKSSFTNLSLITRSLRNLPTNSHCMA